MYHQLPTIRGIILEQEKCVMNILRNKAKEYKISREGGDYLIDVYLKSLKNINKVYLEISWKKIELKIEDNKVYLSDFVPVMAIFNHIDIIIEPIEDKEVSYIFARAQVHIQYLNYCEGVIVIF